MKGSTNVHRPNTAAGADIDEYRMEKLWNGSLIYGWTDLFATHEYEQNALPLWCTWYLGETVVLDQFDLYSMEEGTTGINARKWGRETPRIWEIWGAMNPDPDYDPGEPEAGLVRDFDDDLTWTRLGSFTQTAKLTTNFQVPVSCMLDVVIPVRYLRLKVIEPWYILDVTTGSGFIVAEVTAHGVVQPESE